MNLANEIANKWSSREVEGREKERQTGRLMWEEEEKMKVLR
jgi:hypothetical protein